MLKLLKYIINEPSLYPVFLPVILILRQILTSLHF